MKITAYKERVGSEPEPEQEIFIRVRNGVVGEVIVYACDKDGEKLSFGNFITITKDGIGRIMGFNETLGIKTNKNTSRISIRPGWE